MPGRPEPKSRKSGNHFVRRRNKAHHLAAARLVLESAAPSRDLRETLHGPRRSPAASRTVRTAPLAVPASSVTPASASSPRPVARLVLSSTFAEAALAQTEHRAALVADRALLARHADPPPSLEDPAADRSPAALLADAERLDYQVRLCNAERFALGLASIVDTQAQALWTVNARLRVLEPALPDSSLLGGPLISEPLQPFPGPDVPRGPPAHPPPWAQPAARLVVACGPVARSCHLALPAPPASAGDTRSVRPRQCASRPDAAQHRRFLDPASPPAEPPP